MKYRKHCDFMTAVSALQSDDQGCPWESLPSFGCLWDTPRSECFLVLQAAGHPPLKAQNRARQSAGAHPALPAPQFPISVSYLFSLCFPQNHEFIDEQMFEQNCMESSMQNYPIHTESFCPATQASRPPAAPVRVRKPHTCPIPTCRPPACAACKSSARSTSRAVSSPPHYQWVAPIHRSLKLLGTPWASLWLS